MKERILQVLKAKDEYVSGQELCDELSVSRTAVWKAINSLKEAGYEIEAVRNRGYRLISSPDILLSDEIKSQLATKWWGNEILYFSTIDSTNSEVKRQAEAGAKEGLLVIAEEQTAGRGRRGRSWESPAGSGIWMSFLLKPDFDPGQASMVTLVAALACAEAIKNITGLQAYIKWPNDIVINGHKAVGILTEMSTELTCINYVVIGIGINANVPDFPPEIEEIATSLMKELGQKVSRSRIVAEFGRYFEQYYESFCQKKDLSGIKEAYEALLINRGKEVIIHAATEAGKVTAVGINNQGELITRDENGQELAVRAGEVSVRGLYGYV